MPLPPHQVYRDQLTSLYHGHALWDPDPAGVYEGVSVGDVGYTREGYFFRMFNVLLEWDNPLNRILFQPEYYPRLELGPFVNIKESMFSKGDYHSRFVIAEEGVPYHAQTPDDSPFTKYFCRRRQGGLLALPYDGLRKDVIRTKVFEEYIRDHVDSWFFMAQKHKLDVERMEDLILVTGCTLVPSWGVAAFVDSASEAELLMRFRAHQNGGAGFEWHENRPSVAFHNSHQSHQALHQDPKQCVFIRGFRAKRVVFLWTRLRGAAEPGPDDPDNRPEDDIQLTRVPDVPNYRDPLIGILDYIAEKCPDTGDIVAITHDDDAQLVDSEEVDVLTADAVEGFLRRKEINVLIENGGAILQEEEPVIPDETKAIFYAVAELAGELVPLVLHPALSKYFIELDISSQSIDRDYDLPNEELTSPAVHPPMPSLKLDNHQGYPQSIDVQAPSDSPGAVTVQDVLKTIHEDLRKPSRRREWNKLNVEERAAVDAAFRKRGKTEEELGQGLCRIDYLRGRNRLQILPKLSPDGEMLPAPPEEAWRDPMQVDEPNVAGPSRIPAR